MIAASRCALVALAVALAPAAAGGCGDDGDAPSPTRDPRAVPDASAASEGQRVIRNWVVAVDAGKFDLAARYFAPGAIVDQGEEVVLRGRADAIRFNRSLPCRADVTDFEDEGGTILAAFRLRRGHQGDCAEGGRARVRFVIRDGLIKEWRQLPEERSAPNESA